jgi:imidazolonepropionase
LIDFEKRISGATYEEIAAAGGGIRSSIAAVRNVSRSEIAQNVLGALNEAATLGTTTLEAKSGYGLSLATELKSLEAIRDAAAHWPGTVVPTFLGAHVVPPEFLGSPEKYVALICEQMIPRVAQRKLAKFVDVFCDRGAFDEEQATAIFTAALKYGLRARVHLAQLAPAAEGFVKSVLNGCHPASLDHMDHVRDDEIAELSAHDTVVTLVPGANYFLGLRDFPPARKLMDGGVAVALATDFNPGSSPTISMPFVLSLACTHMQMTPAEAITAATINGAWALGLGASKGSIEPGKDADISIFDVKDHREIAYWVASNRCERVIANGVLLARASSKGET